MAIYHGNYVNMDYGDLELTEDLKEALVILDASCRGGSGGTYDINETVVDEADWEAVPCDGPFDTLYFIDGDWTETIPDEDDEDEDEDEDGHTESEARTQAGMEGGARALAEFDGLELDDGDSRIDEEGFIEFI